MGKAHSNAWRQAPRFLISNAMCGCTPFAGATPPRWKARAQFGWDHAVNDWRTVVADPEIDVIDINTPNDSHAEIAIAAAEQVSMCFAKNRSRWT